MALRTGWCSRPLVVCVSLVLVSGCTTIWGDKDKDMTDGPGEMDDDDDDIDDEETNTLGMADDDDDDDDDDDSSDDFSPKKSVQGQDKSKRPNGPIVNRFVI